MNKYTKSLIGILCAIIMTAHTSVFTYRYSFCFIGNPLSQSSVEDKSNWSSTAICTCNGIPNKACKITVDSSYVQFVNGDAVLKSNTNIIAVPGAGGSANGYVPSLASTIISKSDKN